MPRLEKLLRNIVILMKKCYKRPFDQNNGKNVIRVKAILNNWILQEILDESAIYQQAQLQGREIKHKREETKKESESEIH